MYKKANLDLDAQEEFLRGTNDDDEARAELFEAIFPKYPTVFAEWFFARFRDPRAWLRLPGLLTPSPWL
jgi:hypothetical protein